MLKKSFLSKKMIFIILFLICSSLTEGKGVKNIIFMVPDGLGISPVIATRIYAYGTSSQRLFFETLEQIGYQSTYSSNSLATDSAAAASAWACGDKFNNGEISFHHETRNFPKTILELAQGKGKKTGLVATSVITDATPAAFASHVESRRNEDEIARQLIIKTKVDVLLGGGKKIFESSEIIKNISLPHDNLIKIALEKGYDFVETREELQKSRANEKLLGLFRPASLTPAFQKKVRNDSTEPSLAEMSQAALKILERGRNGFFLLIEGSQIDWANHENHLEYLIDEILEFDKAVKVVLEWIGQKKSRKNDTLIIIVSDHDCGDLAIMKEAKGEIWKKPGQHVKVEWISKNHTGEDTIIWSQGPYSEHLGRAIDNTDIFHIMKAALDGKEYKKSQGSD